MTSHNSLPYATPTCDSYGRTDGRTNEESWLSRGDHLPFADARAHIRQFPLAEFEARLAASVEVTGFCWLWTASVDVHGYGYVSVDRKKLKAHRWTYFHLVGPIADHLVLDHLCRVRNCVNPDHLEPVTRAENNARSWWAIKRYCPKGHDQSPSGGHVYVRKNGKRMCRTCANEAIKRWAAKNRRSA